MPPELWQVVAVAGSALTGWVAWVKGVSPAVRWISSVKDKMDDLYGEAERPGVPARPGMMERLAETDLAVAEIKAAIPGLTSALQEIQVRDAERAEAIRIIQYHVQPNHGNSAYDAMGRKVDDVAAKLDAIPRVEQAQLVLADSADKLGKRLDRVHEQIGGLIADKRAAHEEIRARLARIETHPQTEGEES